MRPAVRQSAGESRGEFKILSACITRAGQNAV
ncbi:hypothetical protein METH_16160 [Leisingera methylohalidivorans DSM 14336]|uniref:Uncharacterized protein n=1 Tax=Leisingera methylohalidivorans DSM 14336 TaxID=999552 RepID=V9W0M5_9RHOB|nr:hypothetical protein METH_16160 [Leisingera methylohalidivorans DSM 14336]